MDYIEDLDLLDLPPSQLELLEGDALMLLRNINTRAGLAKGKRCRAREIGLITIVVKFENDQEDTCTFGRVRMEKTLDGVTFVRCQVPFRKVYAGTGHRAQGRTLLRVVIDSRTKWWEHGQVYMGFSRVTSPRYLCVLIQEDRQAERIEAIVDRDVVDVIQSIGVEANQGGDGGAAQGVGAKSFQRSLLGQVLHPYFRRHADQIVGAEGLQSLHGVIQCKQDGWITSEAFPEIRISERRFQEIGPNMDRSSHNNEF
jgi:hypothetical protein